MKYKAKLEFLEGWGGGTEAGYIMYIVADKFKLHVFYLHKGVGLLVLALFLSARTGIYQVGLHFTGYAILQHFTSMQCNLCDLFLGHKVSFY